MRIYEIESPVLRPIVSASCYFQRVSYLYELSHWLTDQDPAKTATATSAIPSIS